MPKRGKTATLAMAKKVSQNDGKKAQKKQEEKKTKDIDTDEDAEEEEEESQDDDEESPANLRHRRRHRRLPASAQVAAGARLGSPVPWRTRIKHWLQ